MPPRRRFPPAVAAAMNDCLTADGNFANAASASHAYGRRAARAVDEARQSVAEFVGVESRQIVFTSGATESDNLAIIGAARYGRRQRGHVVASRTDHKAVTDSIRRLAGAGFDVTWLTPGPGGLVDPTELERVIRPDTALVAVTYVNNELGTVQPVAAIAGVCRQRGVLLHVDAAQAPGKVARQELIACDADFIALSAHKMYGPKGIGALVVRADVAPRLEPLIVGGGHERGLRSGTLPVHQVVGFGVAARELGARDGAELARIDSLRTRLLDSLHAVGGVRLNGHPRQCAAGIVNVAVDGVNGESLLQRMAPVAVSAGSACTSAVREPSYVLRALGLDDELAEASLRFSFGRYTSVADIDAAGARFRAVVESLRAIAAPFPAART